eukprot:5080872-Alexandrium_andersonii.AAC.1
MPRILDRADSNCNRTHAIPCLESRRMTELSTHIKLGTVPSVELRALGTRRKWCSQVSELRDHEVQSSPHFR